MYCLLEPSLCLTATLSFPPLAEKKGDRLVSNGPQGAGLGRGKAKGSQKHWGKMESPPAHHFHTPLPCLLEG